jgi:hypothetical protein
MWPWEGEPVAAGIFGILNAVADGIFFVFQAVALQGDIRREARILRVVLAVALDVIGMLLAIIIITRVIIIVAAIGILILAHGRATEARRRTLAVGVSGVHGLAIRPNDAFAVRVVHIALPASSFGEEMGEHGIVRIPPKPSAGATTVRIVRVNGISIRIHLASAQGIERILRLAIIPEFAFAIGIVRINGVPLGVHFALPGTRALTPQTPPPTFPRRSLAFRSCRVNGRGNDARCDGVLEVELQDECLHEDDRATCDESIGEEEPPSHKARIGHILAIYLASRARTC